MDCKDLKKLLAGLGVASLISSGGAILPGAHAASSGGTAKPSAVSVEETVKKAVPTG